MDGSSDIVTDEFRQERISKATLSDGNEDTRRCQIAQVEERVKWKNAKALAVVIIMVILVKFSLQALCIFHSYIKVYFLIMVSNTSQSVCRLNRGTTANENSFDHMLALNSHTPTLCGCKVGVLQTGLAKK